MISKINSTTPSFGGIVRVCAIFKDGVLTDDRRFVNAATKQLKAILLGKEVFPPKPNYECLEPNYQLFRKIYGHFDSDYGKINLQNIKDDGRSVFCNNRTGTQRYLLSGPDAASVAVKGKNIGDKKALERTDYKKLGVGEKAKEDYHSVKSEKAAKYKYSSQNHPAITLYTRLDKTGKKPILMAAYMEDDFNKVNRNPNGWTSTVYFDRMFSPRKSPKPVSPKAVSQKLKSEPKLVQGEFNFD